MSTLERRERAVTLSWAEWVRRRRGQLEAEVAALEGLLRERQAELESLRLSLASGGDDELGGEG